MTVLTEGDLQITVTNAVSARKFDDASHRLSHCMKAVDFIVELPDRYLFIEFKDPRAPGSTPEQRCSFIQNLQSEQLDETLKYKFRDSFLYQWASGRADKAKAVDYWVLIALDSLDPAMLNTRTEALKRKLPINGPNERPWARPIANSCAVFNIETWNEKFPRYPIERLSKSL